MNELVDEMRATKQRLAGLEQDARQPCLVMEADEPSDTKNCERTKGAAAAVQAKHGDSCSARRSKPAREFLPALVMTSPDLRLSLVQGMMPW